MKKSSQLSILLLVSFLSFSCNIQDRNFTTKNISDSDVITQSSVKPNKILDPTDKLIDPPNGMNHDLYKQNNVEKQKFDFDTLPSYI